MPLQLMVSQEKEGGCLFLCYQHAMPTALKKMLYVFKPWRGGMLVEISITRTLASLSLKPGELMPN